MSDLIRRLREEPKSRERLNGLSSAATVAWHDTCLEAADRIESDAAQIESLQRERDEAIANYTRDVPEFTHRIESQERVIERLKAICLGDESLSKWLDENEELRGLLSKQAEALADKTWPKSAITPEMREKLERWANTIDNARAAGGPVRTAGLHQQRAGEIVDGIRDLLGERGGMGDE